MPPVSSVLITNLTFDKATTLSPERFVVFSCPLSLQNATETISHHFPGLKTCDLASLNYVQKTLTHHQLNVVLLELLKRLDPMHTKSADLNY